MTGKSMRCDSHVHVVGPVETYPQLATRTYLALPAPLEELSRNAAPSGVSRFVIVQPSFYGADNTMLLESLDALGSRGRGVAVIDPARTSKSMLDRYAARGVCGLRLNLYSPMGNSGGRLARDFSAVAAVAGAMGWHVEVIVPIAILAEAGILGHAETTVVIDHYGVYGHSTPDSADGRALLDLVAVPHVWMKLSAPYRVSDDPLNARPDPAWLTAILDRGRERCVWGSDWPHTPGHDAQRGPDVAGIYRPLPYTRLVDDFISALGSDELGRMIMTDNPARLYGFGGLRRPRSTPCNFRIASGCGVDATSSSAKQHRPRRHERKAGLVLGRPTGHSGSRQSACRYVDNAGRPMPAHGEKTP